MLMLVWMMLIVLVSVVTITDSHSLGDITSSSSSSIDDHYWGIDYCINILAATTVAVVV